jgi:hypothetical protein
MSLAARIARLEGTAPPDKQVVVGMSWLMDGPAASVMVAGQVFKRLQGEEDADLLARAVGHRRDAPWVTAWWQ